MSYMFFLMGFKLYCYKAIEGESGNWNLDLLAYSPRYCISVTGCFCFTLYNLMVPRSYRTSCSYSWSRRHGGDWTHSLRENIASAFIGFLKHFVLNKNHEWYELMASEGNTFPDRFSFPTLSMHFAHCCYIQSFILVFNLGFIGWRSFCLVLVNEEI